MFKTFKELQQEIERRDYADIVGLKAKITKAKYIEMLEVLPPIPAPNGFLLSETLSHNENGAISYYFYKQGKDYYCEIVQRNKFVLFKELVDYAMI